MDSSELASGDALALQPPCFDKVRIEGNQKEGDDLKEIKDDQMCMEEIAEPGNEITPQVIESNEQKLKSRIAECKSVIESLKSELNVEKARLEREAKMKQTTQNLFVSEIPSNHAKYSHVSSADLQLDDINNMYSTSVDSKLYCDENLMEYEKQLQKYQNTLNMAQNEKKNAIRKQMLAKAYRLKLLEVENQCNIELLRVKQSLQCLEPLKMIASKWKTNTDNICDMNNFEFVPRYPELNANSGSDINSYKEEQDNKTSENLDHGSEGDKCER